MTTDQSKARRAYHPYRPYWLYRYYDDCGVLLYVGIAREPDKRRAQHSDPWMHYVAQMRVASEPYLRRRDAEDVEAECIKTEGPIFNWVHAGASHLHSAVAYVREHGDDGLVYRRRLAARICPSEQLIDADLDGFLAAYEAGRLDTWREARRPERQQAPPTPPRPKARRPFWDWPSRDIEVDDETWRNAKDVAHMRYKNIHCEVSAYLRRYAERAARAATTEAA